MKKTDFTAESTKDESKELDKFMMTEKSQNPENTKTKEDTTKWNCQK